MPQTIDILLNVALQNQQLLTNTIKEIQSIGISSNKSFKLLQDAINGTTPPFDTLKQKANETGGALKRSFDFYRFVT